MIGLKLIGKVKCDDCGTGYSVNGPLNVFRPIKTSDPTEFMVFCDECIERMEEEERNDNEEY